MAGNSLHRRSVSAVSGPLPFLTLLYVSIAVLIAVGVWYGLKMLQWKKPRLAFEAVIPVSDRIDVSLPPLNRVSDAVVRHTVKKGDTLGLMFEQHGFKSANVPQLEAEIHKLNTDENKKPAALRKGQILEFSLGPDGVLREVRSKVSAGNELQAVRRPDGTFAAVIHSLPKQQQERVLLGVIENSFAGACSNAGVPYDIVDDLVDLFGNKIAFHKDFKKGDRFTIIYRDKMLEDGKTAGAGPILAAAIETGGKKYYAVRYVGTDGKARYFDKEGKPLESEMGFLRYPAKFTRISSGFSAARFHPVLRIRRPHNGVDFAAPIGTPVRSVADGRVVIAGNRGSSGIMVKIEHSARYSTAYLHLSKIEKDVREGARVSRGQVIGAVGMTGLSTGPHLHYSFYDNGKYVDPLKIELPTLEPLNKGNQINPRYLKRVMFTLKHYQRFTLSDSYWG